MSGWFSVKRGMLDHPIFHKRPDRTYIWLWMLDMAAYQDTRQDAGGKPVEVKRGQLLTSYRQIEAATGVGMQVIRTLFKLLSNERSINTDTSNGRLLITISNYEKYQRGSSQASTAANTEPTQSQHTKETSKQIPPSEGASAPADLVDPDKVMFDAGRRLLASAGKSAAAAGQMLGKWRKDHGTEAVISAISRARREGAIEPISYIEKCLRFQKAEQAKPKRGDLKTTRDGRVLEWDGWTWECRNDLTAEAAANAV